MRNPLIMVIALASFALFQSCEKESIDIQSMWDCHASQEFDSAKLASKLIGTWKWTKQANELTGLTKADKNVKVTFNSNGIFSVTENGAVTTQGTWKLEIVDGNCFGIDTNPYCTYLFGRILLCNYSLLFNNSYIDGSDNVFIRSDS